MGYFPFFVDIAGKNGVVVGGGKVAARKVEKLMPFGPKLTVIAPCMAECMLGHKKSTETGASSLRLMEREFVMSDLAGADFVIAATDDESLNSLISDYCKRNRIPVNVVDDREKCSFFFPALVREGDLTIGISTDGKCPAAASWVRRKISQALPMGIGDAIDLMGQIRPQVKELAVSEAERKDWLERMFLYCMEKNGAEAVPARSKKIRIGTRGSKLALKQAALVQEALLRAKNGIEAEIIIVHTKGDRIQDKPLSEIGDKGVFASELEQALLGGEIDLAVHSAKDLPVTLAEGLTIAAVLPRADVRDVLVIPKDGRMPVPAGARQEEGKLFEEGAGEAEAAGKSVRNFVVGTGSRRRQMLAGQLWDHVVCENIRGNVDTRLRKLKDGGGDGVVYDGILLAKAGLDRLGMMSRYEAEFAFYPLSPEEFLPAACQGIIAVEAVKGSAAAVLCRDMTDAETELSFLVEREVLAQLAADCSEAAAAWCRRAGDRQCRNALLHGNEQSQDGECMQGEWILDVMYAGNRVQAVWGAGSSMETLREKKVKTYVEGLSAARRAAKQVKDKSKIG